MPTRIGKNVYSAYRRPYGVTPLIARLMGPTWSPSGADRTQVGPMLVPWTLLSGSHPNIWPWMLQPAHLLQDQTVTMPGDFTLPIMSLLSTAPIQRARQETLPSGWSTIDRKNSFHVSCNLPQKSLTKYTEQKKETHIFWRSNFLHHSITER